MVLVSAENVNHIMTLPERIDRISADHSVPAVHVVLLPDRLIDMLDFSPALARLSVLLEETSFIDNERRSSQGKIPKNGVGHCRIRAIAMVFAEEDYSLGSQNLLMEPRDDTGGSLHGRPNVAHHAEVPCCRSNIV